MNRVMVARHHVMVAGHRVMVAGHRVMVAGASDRHNMNHSFYAKFHCSDETNRILKKRFQLDFVKIALHT